MPTQPKFKLIESIITLMRMNNNSNAGIDVKYLKSLPTKKLEKIQYSQRSLYILTKGYQ